MLKVPSWQSRPVSAADFVRERYDEVFEWCLQITGNDFAEAEDLVHDAYVLFRNSSTSTADVRNLEGYVYVVLPNLHRSRYERKRRHVPIPILDYDCARIGLATTDPTCLK